MKVYNLPEIMRYYIEKMEELGISQGALMRLTNLSSATIVTAKRNPEHITIATAQKIINAIKMWSHLQQRAILGKK